MLTKEKVIETLSNHLVNIKGFGIERIGVFGSFSRGKETNESDIDILVEFQEGSKSFDNLMELYGYLKELFGDDRKIELVTRESLSPYIGPRILREVIYIEGAS